MFCFLERFIFLSIIPQVAFFVWFLTANSFGTWKINVTEYCTYFKLFQKLRSEKLCHRNLNAYMKASKNKWLASREHKSKLHILCSLKWFTYWYFWIQFMKNARRIKPKHIHKKMSLSKYWESCGFFDISIYNH